VCIYIHNLSCLESNARDLAWRFATFPWTFSCPTVAGLSSPPLLPRNYATNREVTSVPETKELLRGWRNAETIRRNLFRRERPSAIVGAHELDNSIIARRSDHGRSHTRRQYCKTVPVSSTIYGRVLDTNDNDHKFPGCRYFSLSLNTPALVSTTQTRESVFDILTFPGSLRTRVVHTRKTTVCTTHASDGIRRKRKIFRDRYALFRVLYEP